MSDDQVETPAANAVLERKPRSGRRRAVKDAPAEALTTLAQAVIEHAPTEPLLPSPNDFTPPAAVSADSQEDPVMDTVDTAAQNTAAFANDAAERTAAAGQAAADFSGRAQDAMARGTKMLEEMNDFGKGNVEAIVESGRIAAKGAETLGQQAAEFARKSFEDATAAMRTLAATRSPTEFVRLQGDYVRQMFDAMVAESSKSTEAMIKLANDVSQPLSNRFALAAEKVRTAA